MPIYRQSAVKKQPLIPKGKSIKCYLWEGSPDKVHLEVEGVLIRKTESIILVDIPQYGRIWFNRLNGIQLRKKDQNSGWKIDSHHETPSLFSEREFKKHK